ncbi:MAG: DUF1858 domain-containing protein, partial [Paenibacillaceae bacterium]|nr:DUF1858 domain-containing protein [Paenibacillaceae bacterium]
MSNYFKASDTIFHITETYPETIEVFIANGFENLSNPVMRRTLGKTISLETALAMRKVNQELFIKKLEEVIGEKAPSLTDGLTPAQSEHKGDIRIEGVLPCPIRIPLLEKFESWLEENKDSLGYEVEYHLKSANLGLDDVKDRVILADGNPDGLSDLYLSAGFDLFFDKKMIGG